MIVINKENIDGKWVDYSEDVRFKIKPFKASYRSIRPNGSLADVLKKQAESCLVGWEGIKDSNGEDVKFSNDNKNFILEYSEALIQWVAVESQKLSGEIVSVVEKKT